ncbi:hypothetical protein MAPG_01928 [Magnaporthiopsis poae ATCC 64411]|uniref:Uncharacterized protein n=1 Tax=Magnaporthiopsis poae (strain ATCC 64411 / 73-15) TaxID=644358 RepID=A0A0C4DPZ7_MAGP6|nr:hypothetical protein MAPG_01928 [Magnaporthiopsis poae ATCC 64411]
MADAHQPEDEDGSQVGADGSSSSATMAAIARRRRKASTDKDAARLVYKALNGSLVHKRRLQTPVVLADGTVSFPGTGISPCILSTVEVGHTVDRDLVRSVMDYLLDPRYVKADGEIAIWTSTALRHLIGDHSGRTLG